MNTKSFLSYGGLEFTFKAVYSGIPMLCLSLFGDQLKNTCKLEKVGTGFYVNKFTFTPNPLSEQIKTIIENKNDKSQSNLLRMKIISHYSSKKLNYAADLLEQHPYTAKSCRKYEHYDTNSNL